MDRVHHRQDCPAGERTGLSPDRCVREPRVRASPPPSGGWTGERQRHGHVELGFGGRR